MARERMPSKGHEELNGKLPQPFEVEGFTGLARSATEITKAAPEAASEVVSGFNKEASPRREYIDEGVVQKFVREAGGIFIGTQECADIGAHVKTQKLPLAVLHFLSLNVPGDKKPVASRCIFATDPSDGSWHCYDNGLGRTVRGGPSFTALGVTTIVPKDSKVVERILSNAIRIHPVSDALPKLAFPAGYLGRTADIKVWSIIGEPPLECAVALGFSTDNKLVVYDHIEKNSISPYIADIIEWNLSALFR